MMIKPALYQSALSGTSVCSPHVCGLDGGRSLLAEAVTNADGRTDARLLDGAEYRAGGYELLFSAGDYLKATGQVGGGVLFLDEIPIRFGITDPEAHYHVPLLLSAFGYSTYRGS